MCIHTEQQIKMANTQAITVEAMNTAPSHPPGEPLEFVKLEVGLAEGLAKYRGLRVPVGVGVGETVKRGLRVPLAVTVGVQVNAQAGAAKQERRT